jgi:uncharacterized membrane protein
MAFEAMIKTFNSRLVTIDIVRTFAIVLMVIFHFLYDLKYFGWVDWDTPDGPGWKQFRFVIVTLFLATFGTSLVLAHAKGIRWKAFRHRLFQLVGASIAITVVSLVTVPANWIFFGILHFIAVASILVIGFIGYPKVSLVIGVGIVTLYNLGVFKSFWPFGYVSEWLPSYTNDYVGLSPWLGVVFIGVFLGHQTWLHKDPLVSLSSQSWLVKPGQHSLIIYLVHQPLFFGIFELINLVK